MDIIESLEECNSDYQSGNLVLPRQPLKYIFILQTVI